MSPARSTGRSLATERSARTCREIQRRYFRPPPDAIHPPQPMKKVGRRRENGRQECSTGRP
jgi:hypothetical protein